MINKSTPPTCLFTVTKGVYTQICITVLLKVLCFWFSKLQH